MKHPLHPAIECLMAAKERPVELADMDGSRSARAAAGDMNRRFPLWIRYRT